MGRSGKKLARLDIPDDAFSDSSMAALELVSTKLRCGVAPETSYNAAVSIEHRRHYAQFFTPLKVAKLMAEWTITSDTETLLEPALGMGILTRAARTRNVGLKITAFEKDPVILRAFLRAQTDLNGFEIIFGDFLTSKVLSRFDAILMNPPYLRHHDLSYNFDIFELFSRLYGLKISRLSNAYLLFTLKAASLLKPGGRAAIIVPTEWMNANFGSAMKAFLIERNLLREIIYFSSCSDIFENALTTACILFLERSV